MPGYLFGSFCFDDFGLTTLSNQCGERGEHVTLSCSEVTVKLDHAKEVPKLFHSFGWLNCKYCLHPITLRFDFIFSKAVIFLAHRRIHKYTKDGCECFFLFAAVLLHICIKENCFVGSETNTHYRMTKNTLAGAWAEGAGSGGYFLPPNKFSVHCVLCHIAPAVIFCCVLCHRFSYDSSLIFARIIIK